MTLRKYLAPTEAAGMTPGGPEMTEQEIGDAAPGPGMGKAGRWPVARRPQGSTAAA